MQITFNIPNGKVQRVINAVVGLWPIPLDDNDDPLYTPAQWAKEKIRRRIVDLVYRYERKIAMDTVDFSVVRDDEIVS